MPDLGENPIFAIMLLKRSFFGLFIALVIMRLGIHQNKAPNQEIVVQFGVESIDAEEVENIVSLVREQLKDLGVAQLSVVPSKEGQLVITYYSDLSTEAVKNSLASQGEFAVEDSQDPSPETPSSTENGYTLSVSDLYPDQTFDVDSFVIETTLKNRVASFSDALSNSNTYISDDVARYPEESLKISSTVAQRSLQYHYNVPQVRAGPMTAC